MGKKRRLLHSKKFARKHANHPRMKMLNNSAEITGTSIEESIVETAPVLKETSATPIKIEVKDPVIEERPPVPKPKIRQTTNKKKTTQKVAASAAPKNTTKKTTTKKTTTPRKRSTRSNTKTASG